LTILKTIKVILIKLALYWRLSYLPGETFLFGVRFFLIFPHFWDKKALKLSFYHSFHWKTKKISESDQLKVIVQCCLYSKNIGFILDFPIASFLQASKYITPLSNWNCVFKNVQILPKSLFYKKQAVFAFKLNCHWSKSFLELQCH